MPRFFANLGLRSKLFWRDGDPSTIQDSSDDPWQSRDCNLLALADPNGKIVALRTTASGFTIRAAEQMLHRSLREHSSAGWWYGGAQAARQAVCATDFGSSRLSQFGMAAQH